MPTPSTKTLPFVADFDPHFAYDIHIADYTPRRANVFASRHLSPGDLLPMCSLPSADGHWKVLPEPLRHAKVVSLGALAAYKPLVISLYAPEWGDYGQRHWSLLKKAGRQIGSLGGQLLVVTTVPPAALAGLTQQHGVSFSVCHDTAHRLAARLGAYAAAEPLWQRVAGIDADVPMPATLVVGRDGQVRHAFYSPDADTLPDIRTLLEAVYAAGSMLQSA